MKEDHYLTVPKVTHFHTLGIAPGCPQIEAVCAYQRKILEIVNNDHFAFRSSMAMGQAIDEIQHLTDAIFILGHGDRRAKYMKFLKENALLCPLCDGKGIIEMDGKLTRLPCEACRRTGWGTEMLQDYDKPRETIHPIESKG